MKKLPIILCLTWLCAYECEGKHQTTDLEYIAQYRDTLIGRFDGIDIDTLICEPMDSLNLNYKGFHYKWRVFTKNKTVKDLILENKTIGIHFVYEGDLDGNRADEFGIRRESDAGTWDNYYLYTYHNGKWKYLIEPIWTYSDHFDTDLNKGADVVEIANTLGYVTVRFSDIRNDDFCIVDTLLPIAPQSIQN